MRSAALNAHFVDLSAKTTMTKIQKKKKNNNRNATNVSEKEREREKNAERNVTGVTRKCALIAGLIYAAAAATKSE